MSVEMSDSVPCSDVIKYVKVLNSVLTTLLGLIAASWRKIRAQLGSIKWWAP